jgi:hypothetical protein
MTWAEIKKAIEQAGVRDDEEIGLIQCENGDGDHTFHRVKLGKMLKVVRSNGVASGTECIGIGS